MGEIGPRFAETSLIVRPLVVAAVLTLLLAACSESSEAPSPTATALPTAAPAAAAAPPPAGSPAPQAIPPPRQPAGPTATPAPPPTPEPPPTWTPQRIEPATPTPRPAPKPEYERADCKFTVPTGQVAECGFLIVPEDRSDPLNPNIRLHVAVFRSTSASPAPDAVVYLAGGPGENALDPLKLLFDVAFKPFLTNRDLVIFDQRGVGLSEPALECPEVLDSTYTNLDRDLSVDEAHALDLEATFACRDRLISEGVNLAAFSSAESAADVGDLRVVLGYNEWNLYSISYGTKLALTTMRDHPKGIRSVILDSTYPLEVDLIASFPPNTDRVYRKLFDGCAANTACSEAYPDLEKTFYEVVEALNRNPVTNTVTNPFTDESFEQLTDGEGFMDFVYQALYATDLIPLLPEIINDARRRVFDSLARIQGMLFADDEFLSLGMLYSVRCGEEVRFSSREAVAAAGEPYPRLRDYLGSDTTFDVCDSWGARVADPIENQPVESEIPTLVLNGEFDPITPPAWGKLAAGNLSNSYFFEFPGMGHGVSASGECPLSITLSFLADPSIEPDATCVAELGAPRFVVSASGFELVPLEGEGLGITGVAPKSWSEVAPATYAPSLAAGVAIVQSAVPDLGAGQLLVALAGQFGLSDVPESKGTRETDALTWTLYEFEVSGEPVDLALAEAEGGGKSFLVSLTSSPSKRQLHYDEVYLPAIDALKPAPE